MPELALPRTIGPWSKTKVFDVKGTLAAAGHKVREATSLFFSSSSSKSSEKLFSNVSTISCQNLQIQKYLKDIWIWLRNTCFATEVDISCFSCLVLEQQAFLSYFVITLQKPVWTKRDVFLKKNLGFFFINFINYPPSSVLFKNSSLNLEVMGWGIKLWYYVPILPSNCNINSSKILSHANFMLAKGFLNIPNWQHKFL